MKNLFARGGIEFLAVLLGISGSLWIENNRESNLENEQIYNTLFCMVSCFNVFNQSKDFFRKISIAR